MEKRVAELEQAVDDLSRALHDVRLRLADLESRLGAPSAVATTTAREPARLVTAASVDTDAVALLSLIGRTCLVLGGGYLLRALTDAGTLPRPLGTAMGLAYGIAWFVAAWRASATGRAAGAAFHAIAAVLIAFPLLWEATIRIHFLSQRSAVVAMTGVTSVGLAVAWNRRAQVLAWIVSLAGVLAALAFMLATAAAAPGDLGAVSVDAGGMLSGPSIAAIVLYLAFLGVVTLWFAYRLDWTWLRWPPAIVADVSVLAMIASAADVWHRDQVGTVMLVQLALFAGYLVSFTARTLWRSRQVVPFEVVQTLAMLLVCFGGAIYLMITTGANAKALGVASLVFAAGSYAAAFAFVDWRGGHWRNFVFYASLGVVFMLAGTSLVVAPPLQAIAWGLLAVVTAWGGYRYATITLASHATIYTVAAAIVSALLAHTADAWVASASSTWAPLTGIGALVLLAAAVSSCAPVSSTNESWGGCSRLPKVVLVAVLLWTAGGAMSGLLTTWVAGQPGSGADGAIVASIRTLILGGSVLLLAWAGRGLFVEGRWLSYVVLVAGGVKLLVEDFPNGRPSTLFLSLAVYGGVLILGPRLRTRVAAPAPAQPVGPVV